MDYRAVVLMAGVMGAIGAASTLACTGPDPGAITFAERPGGGGDIQAAPTSTTPVSAPDAGKGHPIFGNLAFAYTDPGVIANTASADHPNQKVEGEDCVKAGCHLDKGPSWMFAGTVYATAGGGATVAEAEIKIVDGAGNEVGKTYTDKNGNFWLEKAGGIPAGSRVGVRKAAGSPMTMSTPLNPTDRSCNTVGTCHGSATTGKIYVP